jgi:hypothetical protein
MGKPRKCPGRRRKQVSSAYNGGKTFFQNIGTIGLHRITTQKILLLTDTSVRTSNPEEFIKVLSGRFIPLRGGGGESNTQQNFNTPHALICILIRWTCRDALLSCSNNTSTQCKPIYYYHTK